MKKLALALIVLCQMAFGQAFINDTAFRSDGRPAANATVRVCTTTDTGVSSAPSTTQPLCSPLATIFQDKDLTLTKTNPFTTDAQGNYSYGIAPGFYKEQLIVGSTILTIIRQAPTSTGTGGVIVGGGDIASAPVAAQTITQPQGTSLVVNSLQKVIYVDPSFNWSQTPTDDLTVAGSNSITLTPCPKGLNGTNPDHYVHIGGTGTAEDPKITGGTCTSGSASGTITVITTNPHSTGWSVSSSTAGWKEASEYAKFAPTSPSGSLQGGVVRGLAGTEYNFTGPLYIESAQQIVDGNGAIFQCSTSPCVHLGDLVSTLDYSNIHLLNVRLRAMIAHAGGIQDNSQGATINGVKIRNSASGSYFDYLIQNDNNQAEHVYDVDPSTGLNWGQCTVEPCSVAIKSTGLAGAGITYVHDSNLTLNCQGNGVDWKNANTFVLDNTVLQGYVQWAGRVVGSAAQPTASLTNVYQEVGSCTNPNGTGTAGWIVQAGNINLQNVTGLNGKYPTITASSPGSTSLVYYLVPKSSSLGTGVPRIIGKCLTSGTGTCTVKWFPIGTTGTITYDLLRVASDLAADKVAPNGTGNYSVATGLTVGGTCTGNTCTVVDDTSIAAASYTVAVPSYFPVIAQWPSQIDLGPNADTTNINNGSARLNADTLVGNSSVPGIVSAAGSLFPTIFAVQCQGLSLGSPAIPSCNHFSASNDARVQTPEILSFGGVTGISNSNDLKGRTIYYASGGLAHTDMVTLSDSNPVLTAATIGNRPPASASDTAMGPANTAVQNAANSRWGIRTPVSLDFYFNSLFDGSAWFHRFSSTSFATKTPIEFDGSTSGLAQIGVAAIAGTPNKLLLPTATGSSGNCLTTDGANPQQTSWIACGAVTSVFGRTGAVVATSGDYTEAQISFTDITTNNASTSKHGFVKKLTGNINDCYNGDGTFNACPGSTGGITTLDTQTGATQTFSTPNSDANVGITITPLSNNHAFLATWTGALIKGRQHAATVYNDAANTWSTGAQDMSAATSFKIPLSAGYSPTASGSIGYDSTANVYKFGANGSTKFIATIDGNIATATALAANGSNCTGIQFPKGVDASGASEGCVSLADADIPDTITAINYLLLAGGTMTGQLIASNQGIEFTESDTNPTCATGNFNIYSDLSENKLKKCQNGTVTDLDTSGVAIPGGANTQFQFNDGGVLNGDSGAVYDKSTGTATFTKVQTTGASADDFTEMVAPTTPAVGHVSQYANSVTHRINDKNASGIVGTTVASDTGAANNFLTGILADGTITKAQPAFTNISGAVTDAQVPDNITINLAATASALAANPSNCSGINWPKGITADGTAEGCAALVDADIPDTITAINYLLLAGGTLTGQLVTSNLGVKFTDSDTNPSCAAGVYSIFADTSETKLKKCTNGVATDLDTTAAPGAAYTTIDEEGSGLTQRTTFNFIGNAITAADNSGASRTDITLSQSPSASTSVVGTGRTLTAGAGLATIGDLSADRTISLDLSTLVSSQTFFDSSAASRTITFGLSGATDPVLSLGNNSFDVSTGVLKQAGVAVATLSDSQSLTNKTLDNTNTLTVKDANLTIQDDGDTTKQIKFQAASISTATTRTITIPDATTTMVGTDTTQTLTNKTLTTPTIASIVNSGTLTLPTSSDTLVGRATTDTLTNKTLTTPIISSISNTGTLTLPTSTDTLVGKATTDTLTNKTFNVESTGNVFTQPTPIWLPAAGCSNTTAGTFWDLPTSTPAVAACVTGTNIQKGVLQYADTTGGFTAQTTIALPADWTSGTLPDVDIYWTTTATTGNAKWTVAFVCTDVAASATDDPAFPTSSNGFNTVTTAAPGTGSRVQTSTITGATLPASCVTATKELLHIKLFRDGNDAADTITASANFVGLMLTPRRAE